MSTDNSKKRSNPGQPDDPRGKRQRRNDDSRSSYLAKVGKSGGRVDSRHGNGKGGSSGESSIQAGDRGIFVSCDMGREKIAGREAGDLVEGVLEEMGMDISSEIRRNAEYGKNEDGNGRTVNVTEGMARDDKEGESGRNIEDDIAAELTGINGTKHKSSTNQPPTSTSSTSNGQSTNTKSLIEVITLDIPCVAFLRLNLPPNLPTSPPTNCTTSTSTYITPTAITLSILRSAFSNSSRPRSRYIKRLTPIERIRKVLNNGLQDLCEEILPRHFSLVHSSSSDAINNDEDTNRRQAENVEQSNSPATGFTFAVALTRRQPATPSNGPELTRDYIIQTIASAVFALGQVPDQVPSQALPTEDNKAIISSNDTTDADARSGGGGDDTGNHGQAGCGDMERSRHSVSLKNYDKLVLVDVYRGIVGMSVIDTGWEEWEGALKKGNLAEIYASAHSSACTGGEKE